VQHVFDLTRLELGLRDPANPARNIENIRAGSEDGISRSYRQNRILRRDPAGYDNLLQVSPARAGRSGGSGRGVLSYETIVGAALNNRTAQIAIDKTPKNPGFMGKPFQATYMPRERS